MRRSLGMLRRDDVDPALQPQPGIDDVGDLLEQAREAGLAVEYAVEESPGRCPRASISRRRIVQEALTNTIKHAGRVPTRITVSYGERELTLEVSDSGPGPSANGGEGRARV